MRAMGCVTHMIAIDWMKLPPLGALMKDKEFNMLFSSVWLQH